MADGRTCCSSLLQELNGIELEELTDLREEEDEDVEHRKSQHSRRDSRMSSSTWASVETIGCSCWCCRREEDFDEVTQMDVARL